MKISDTRWHRLLVDLEGVPMLPGQGAGEAYGRGYVRGVLVAVRHVARLLNELRKEYPR